MNGGEGVLNYSNNPDVCIMEFNQVYEETFSKVRGYISLHCSDINTVPDILQETYLDFYKILSDKGVSYAKDNIAVLMKIAKRKVYRHYSFIDKIKIFIPLIHKNADDEEYFLPDFQDPCIQTVEEDILQKLEAERLWDIINTYPADVRKIIYLYFYEELTLAEIAGVMGWGLSKVKHKLYRTLEEIRRKEQRDE